MANFNIELLTTQLKTGSGRDGKPYNFLEIAYKRLPEGKVEGRKIMSFKNEAVYKTLAEAKTGDKYGVTAEKDGEFWQWTSLGVPGNYEQKPVETTGGRVGANQPRGNSGVNRVTGSNYETPEERRVKQIYIVRQSSLERAMQYELIKDNKKASKEDILKLAQEFADWVLSGAGKDPVKELIDMKDDIPS